MSKSRKYIKCEDCARRGTPKCRHKGEKFSSAVVPGCMVKIEDAGSFLKPKPKAKADATPKRDAMSASPMSNFAYIVNEMREVVKNRMSADHEMTADERAVEKFCKDMISDWAECLARQYKKIGCAVLNFCNAFTLVYPPNDRDCPVLLAGAFEEFKEAMGIETVDRKDEGASA